MNFILKSMALLLIILWIPNASALNNTILLKRSLNNLIESDNSGKVAVYIKSLKTNKILYARNTHERFVPASLAKIFTAEAALLTLGPNFQFRTRLYSDNSKVINGILRGNLYIELTGDPTLTYRALLELIASLKSQGIYAIAGNVYIDMQAYDNNMYAPGWDRRDYRYCFAAPISASIINHNCLPFQMVPAKTAGHYAELLLSPNYFYPPIKNTVITNYSRRATCGLSLRENPNKSLSLAGCMYKGNYTWGASYVVNDVRSYNTRLFKHIFNRLNISVYKNITLGNLPQHRRLLAENRSKALQLIINDMLKKSDNIIASSLFKKLGQNYTHRAGSWQNGKLALHNILRSKLKMNIHNMNLVDGSGLSPYNRTTASQIMDVLNFVYNNYGTSYEFISALPIAGIDGTLRHRMPNASWRVRAKTGTLKGVNTLAGYAISANKEPLAFVILINGKKNMGWYYKSLADKMVTAITHYRG